MKFSLIFILILSTNILFSQNEKKEKATITWTGNTDTYWDIASNWTPAQVPGCK